MSTDNDIQPQRSLWRDGNFLKIFTARTSANFGAMLGGLVYAAILLLDARPGEMAAMTVFGTAPALIFGLSIGAWSDRIKRRRILIAADLGRTAVIISVPVAYFAFTLHMEHLYFVAFVLGVGRTLEEVTAPAYLPTVVGEERLFDANSKISAGVSVVETTAFAAGGWISQLASAAVTMIVQSALYLTGGLATLSIRKPEPAPEPGPRTSHLSEIAAGFRFVRSHPLLLWVVASNSVFGLVQGIMGSQLTLFAVSEVGFDAGVVGTLYAVGGISALIGAVFATRLTRRVGLGRAMALGFIIPGVLTFFYPLAPSSLVIATIFFIIPQLFGDGLWIIHDISEVSLRQTVTPEALRGRVNSLFNVNDVAMTLVGAVIGGVIAETVGLRAAITVAAALIVVSGLVLLFSPVCRVRSAESAAH